MLHPNEIKLTEKNTSDLLGDALRLDMVGGTAYRDALATQLRRQMIDRAPERVAEKEIQ